MSEKIFVDYLKKNRSFQRFMNLWLEKYQSLGHFGGVINLQNPSIEEREMIGGLLGKDYKRCKDIKLSYEYLMKQLKNTKFFDCDFKVVCELYFENELISKKAQKEFEEKQFSIYLECLCKTYQNTKVSIWINEIMKLEEEHYLLIKRSYLNGTEAFIAYVFNGLNQLPVWHQNFSTLAVFANRVSKDPHYFDSGKARRLLLDGIAFLLGEKQKQTAIEDVNLLLYKAGLVKDDLSNHCMIFCLEAYNKNKKLHPAWHEFHVNYEPWNVSLYNLQQISSIKKIKQVYIVENPSIFRVMCLFIKDNKLEDIGLLCVEGQPNLCAYLLLDKINEAQINMYYSGDFDPEGILIADKLNQRYDMLSLWHYEVKDYQLSKSDLTISERRLSIFKNCKSEELFSLCELIQESKRSGYQESLETIYLDELAQYLHEY